MRRGLGSAVSCGFFAETGECLGSALGGIACEKSALAWYYIIIIISEPAQNTKIVY